jgi:transposase
MIDMDRSPPEGRKQPMMGHRRFRPKLCYQLSLDRLVPQNHLLRGIAELVDFSLVYSLARPYYSHTGQPPA